MMYEGYSERVKIFVKKTIEHMEQLIGSLCKSDKSDISDIILWYIKVVDRIDNVFYNEDMLVDIIDSMLFTSSLELNPLNVLSCNFQNYELISNDTDEKKIDISAKFENLSTVKPYAMFPKKFDFECKYRKLLGLCDEKTYQIHIDKMITNNTNYINTNKNTILHTAQNNFMRTKINMGFWIYNNQIGA